MNKYDIRICKCGRIHAIDANHVHKALYNDKNLLLICGGCGYAKLIGANIELDCNDPKNKIYMMYSGDFSAYDDKIITSSDFESTNSQKGIDKIVYSHGYKVPMMTGQYATDYFNGIFSDRWYPDFYKIQRKDVTVNEIMDFINQYKHDRRTVNMNRFINETPEDVLEGVSRYMIEGFNWKGTKWETDWNTK